MRPPASRHEKKEGFVKALFKHPDFRVGVSELATVAPGIAAWGLMTGVAMVKSGMTTVEAVAMTLVVFAGSSQLAAIPLIAAGAPVWVIWATAFCVNLRFVVFSAHMRPYLMHLPLSWRLFHGYLTADMSYVMFTRHYHHPPVDAVERREQLAYLSGGSLFNWFSWQGASLLGIALANVIPAQWGLGFAGILALLGVGCSLASSHLRRVSAAVAGLAAVAAYAMPFKLNIVVAIVSAVALCLIIDASWPKTPLGTGRST